MTEILEAVKTILQQTLGGAALAVLFMAPLFVVGALLHRRRAKLKQQTSEPFTELPLRPPGESLRLKLEDLSSDFDSVIAVAAMIGLGSAMIVASTSSSHRFVLGAVLFLVVIVAYAYAAIRLGKLQKEIWRYRLGFTGERVVGEELNQLLAVGFRVFHDVPFDGFNIDHVLVGSPGVYAVETKARRKPTDIKGADKATVVFDGERLSFPKGKWDTAAVEQARRNARTLETWLTKACGERITANAILALPGWFVTRKAVSDVNVLNPAEIKRSFPAKPPQPLTPEQIQRIAHQLTERCRVPSPAGQKS